MEIMFELWRRRPQGKPLKVGLMLPATGTFAALGTAIENGFKQYVDEQGQNSRNLALYGQDNNGTVWSILYPNVMISSTNAAFNLTVPSTASGHYALSVMTVVALIFLPIVLIYQGWTFWVFRKRISTSMIPPQPEAGRADDRFASAAS